MSGSGAPFGTGSCPAGQAPAGLDAPRCDPSRDPERLYKLAKANNALARMNAKRADEAEGRLAEELAGREWLTSLLDESRSQRDTMYLAKQEVERAVRRVKRVLRKRSVPTMDPVWSAAFNAALDMVEQALRDSDDSPQGRDAQQLDGEAATARAVGIAQPAPTPPEVSS